MSLREQSASNRLYRGEVTNAREAIATYILALKEERDVQRDLDSRFGPYASKDAAIEYAFDWDAEIANAERALVEYDESVTRAETELTRAWKESGIETFRQIGEAITQRDYSGLAI